MRWTARSAWIVSLALAMAAAPVRAGDPSPALTITYAGRVVDAAGTPVAGAAVHVISGPGPQVMVHGALLPWREIAPSPPIEPVGGNRLDTAPAPTGEDGRFVVPAVPAPAGGYVVVVHPGFVSARVRAEPARLEGSRLDLGDVALRRGGTLRATVTDAAGAPVAGAWVVVQPRHMPWDRFSPGEIRSGRTGPDGVGSIEGLRDVEYTAAAFTDAAPPVEHEFRVAEGERHEVALRLAPGATLRVIARDRASGAPLSGARVDLDPRPPEGASVVELGAGPMATARTGADGVAAFPGLEDREYVATVVPPDRQDDHVHHPGAFSVTVTGRPGTDLEARLDPPVACALSVVDAATGAPVAGLTWEARADWNAYDRTGGTPVDLRGTAAGAKEALVVDGLRSGPWWFRLFAPGYHPRRTDVIRVTAGMAPVRVEMNAATGTAFGRIVSRREGAPVAGAAVASYEWVQEIGDGQRATATADASGRFRLSPLLGVGVPLRLEVTAPGFLTLVAGQTADDRREDVGDLALVRAATVRGVLVDDAGHPRPGLEVLLLPEGEDGRGKGRFAAATTDAQGRFAFEGVPPGPHRLRADAGVAAAIDVAEGAEVTVRLAPPLAGR